MACCATRVGSVPDTSFLGGKRDLLFFCEPPWGTSHNSVTAQSPRKLASQSPCVCLQARVI